ncbi:MAG TPA: prepilin-type N-terminal cleavage/methylation domain-containing protein [Candidatus Saccharimonadales bacterium]|nr:prepilin-type N-terminal cleavage/methylation domain-containing protein [Candidatus Saccharimonadales bacterium]
MPTTRDQRGFGVVEVVIVLAVIALLAVGGWYVWQAQNKGETPPPTNNGSQTVNQNVSKMPELGVEFDKKSGITPLYKMTDYSFGGVNHKLIRLSTQQLVDKGATGGDQNVCGFDPSTPWGDADHPIVTVSVYSSQADLLAVEKNRNSNITAAEIKPENGYITVGSKIFAVPLPGTVQSGSGGCISDTAFENAQRSALQSSLLTLRASQ